jgi:hypothetical protein
VLTCYMNASYGGYKGASSPSLWCIVSILWVVWCGCMKCNTIYVYSGLFTTDYLCTLFIHDGVECQPQSIIH